METDKKKSAAKHNAYNCLQPLLLFCPTLLLLLLLIFKSLACDHGFHGVVFNDADSVLTFSLKGSSFSLVTAAYQGSI